MTTAEIVQGTLDAEALKFLATCQGPCITMLAPGHQPGAQARTRRALLRNLVHRAGELLTGSKLASRSAELLTPLEELAQEPEMEAGGPPLAIFRAPRTLARYAAHVQQAEKVVLASHCLLTPFIASAATAGEFLILGLGKKHLRLFRSFNRQCQELTLPANVPASVQDATQTDKPDHNLSNRSSAGASVGAMGGVRFGTTADREAAGDYLHHFFNIVDRGLADIVGKKPLLLAGVHEEIAEYRRVAKHGNILPLELDGSVEHLTTDQVETRAAEAMLAYHHQAAEQVLAEFREMTDRERVSSEIRPILRAAAQGRAHRLCIREGSEMLGQMESSLDCAHLAKEDLLNAAVVETLRTGGEVFALPADKMPESDPVAAILRY